MLPRNMGGALLSLSTNAFPANALTECLEYVAHLGLAGVEVGSQHAERLALSPLELEHTLTLFRTLNLRPLSVHAFKGYGVSRLERLCDFAHRLGTGLIVVHCRHEEIVENPSFCADMLRRWNDWCRERGIILTVENSSIQPIQEFVRLFRAVPGLQLTLDVKHAYKPEKLGLTHEDYIRELGDRLANLHVSGIDRTREELGDGCPPGRDHVDWCSLAAALAARNYSGLVTMELTLPTWLSQEEQEQAYYDLPPASSECPTISHRLVLHGTRYFGRALRSCLAT
ncbi:MAG: sugar phosphate isomerase/epimerase [Kiritimatiellae bacterium]|nr:sugar phosphate isomerase/epimerase [Kiritimatiellia bacterium]